MHVSSREQRGEELKTASQTSLKSFSHEREQSKGVGVGRSKIKKEKRITFVC